MSKQRISRAFLAVTGAALMAVSSVASADYIATYEGNDCAGIFGDNFTECAIPVDIDPNESPVIIKFEDYESVIVDEEEGTFTFSFGKIEINTGLFSTIDGSEFEFMIPFADGSVGEWIYTPGDGDPAVNFFVAKGGNFFNLFDLDEPGARVWNTPFVNGNFAGLSHLTFYDTGGTRNVPEPATLLLLAAALLGLSRSRRRRDG